MQISKQIGYSCIEDTPLETIYISLYMEHFGGKVLPSTISIRNNSIGILRFFQELKNYYLISKLKSISDLYLQDDDAYISESVKNGNEEVTFLYAGSSKQNLPVLVKIIFGSDNSAASFYATSLDVEYLDWLYSEVKEKFCLKFDKKAVSFGIIFESNGSLQIKKYPLDDKYSANLDIRLNYGSRFEKHHKAIVDKLNETNRGLFIFHGEPGTGKSTYIKHLAKVVGGRKTFIFIPTTFIESLVSPSLIPLLLKHRNSVLVLEDAEKAVISRDRGQGNESLVSTLLNIGDGILGSMLNISIILTYNTSKDKIDEALLRKGRLMYEYKFDALSKEDSKTLFKKLNKTFEVMKPMTLADIYNFEDNNNKVCQTLKSDCI